MKLEKKQNELKSATIFSNAICSDFLAFDLDGTLLKYNSTFCFYFFCLKKGDFPLKSVLSASWQFIKKKLWFSYTQWAHNTVERVLRGCLRDDLERFATRFVEAKLHTLYYTPVKNIIDQAMKDGVPVMILSSGPDFLVEAIAKKMGVSNWGATTFEEDSMKRVTKIDCFMEGVQKALVLQELAKEGKFCLKAFSNDADDLPFLLEAKKAIVVRPSRALKRVAKKRSWSLL